MCKISCVVRNLMLLLVLLEELLISLSSDIIYNKKLKLLGMINGLKQIFTVCATFHLKVISAISPHNHIFLR